jgi:anti-sigma-K factor RskA
MDDNYPVSLGVVARPRAATLPIKMFSTIMHLAKLAAGALLVW